MHFPLLKSATRFGLIYHNTTLITSSFNILHRKISLSGFCLLVAPGYRIGKQKKNINKALVNNRTGGYSLSTVNSLSIMADNDSGLSLKMVVGKLNSFAPTSLAESWDNVGLLVEPTKPKKIRKIILTNDLTEDVMEEAVELCVDLIISYHPPIFAPLKSITTRTWKERVIATCIENRIALYSPHTSFDAVKGGVNDWLASAFDTESVTPLTPAFGSDEDTNSRLVEVMFPKTEAGSSALADFQSKLGAKGGGSGEETLCTNIATLPSGETKLTIPCPAALVPELAHIFYGTALGMDRDRFKVMKYEKIPIPGHGMGRLCCLKDSLSVGEVVECVKDLIKIPNLRLATAVGKNIKSSVTSIAICAGSGASVLRGVKADLYLTGEMLHHDILDAVHRGSHVILCNHSDSERGFLTPFSHKLSAELLEGRVQVVVSKFDRDPLTTV